MRWINRNEGTCLWCIKTSDSKLGLHVRRLLVMVCLCCGAGAFIAVGVALSIAMSPISGSSREIAIRRDDNAIVYLCSDRVGYRSYDWLGTWPATDESTPVTAEVPVWWPDDTSNPSHFVVASGWPLPCLVGRRAAGVVRWSSLDEASCQGLIRVYASKAGEFHHGLVPIRPWWPGLITNVVFWSAAAIGCAIVIPAIRQRHLALSGRCPSCGFPCPQVISGGCPKCGWGGFRR